MAAFKSEDFDLKTALLAAQALAKIFARRTHIKVILGEERRVAGTLGQAVNLPGMTAGLEHRSQAQRERALADFRALWNTLSASTCNTVLEDIGWYDPKKLDWEDVRSNRRPDVLDDPT